MSKDLIQQVLTELFPFKEHLPLDHGTLRVEQDRSLTFQLVQVREYWNEAKKLIKILLL